MKTQNYLLKKNNIPSILFLNHFCLCVMISKKQGIVQMTSYAKQHKFKQRFNFNYVSLQNVLYGLFFFIKICCVTISIIH